MSATLLSEPAVERPPVGDDMVWLPGGTFLMGSDRHYPEEAPSHRVHVSGFWMDRTPVTNREFRRFVQATGYVTFAELAPDPRDYPGALPHMLKAGSLVFTPPGHAVDLRHCGNWWRFVFGASWRRPYGLDRAARPGLATVVRSVYATWRGSEAKVARADSVVRDGSLDPANSPGCFDLPHGFGTLLQRLDLGPQRLISARRAPTCRCHAEVELLRAAWLGDVRLSRFPALDTGFSTAADQ